ncbi:MAG: hypothetical protein AABW72_01245 [archaeon]
MGETKELLWKVFLFAISFLIVVFILIQVKFISNDWIQYFWRSDKWLELFFVIIVTYGFSMLLKLILKWQVRAETLEPTRIRRRIKKQ